MEYQKPKTLDDFTLHTKRTFFFTPKAAKLRPKTPNTWAGHRDPDSKKVAS